ncbi:MAG: LCP family protein, partial [Lachnospiraceae bacterium]|nr:LCP family protein [Lachnospiraceae bacterium]
EGRPSGQPRRPSTSGQARPSGQPRPSGASGQQRPTGQPRRQAADGQPGVTGQPRPAGASGQPRRQAAGGQQRPTGQPRRQAADGEVRAGRPVREGSSRPPGASGQPRRQAKPANQPRPAGKSASGKPHKNSASKASKRPPSKKTGKKIILFVSEILLLLLLLGALWAMNQAQKIQLVEIDPSEVHINKEVQEVIDQGESSMLGYRNIALFGVDSRNKELDKNTRTDVIMIASINQDTKEVKLVSVYRDTWLNMTNDKYSKANAAYAKGGAQQAIGMLNMNLDLDITDFVTVGFDAVIDLVDAVGGVEINVTEEEIAHLNSYQISMVGRVVGKDASGNEMYEAIEGVEYTAVKHAGLQTLNGLQATAYCRIRYTSGGDGARTERQRTVLTQIAKKAMTLNPTTLNNIASAIFGEIATSLTLPEILTLLSDIANYEIGETVGFPFNDHVKMNGVVGKASVVVPIDLTKNVTLLHEFLFDESGYTPTETVKRCSQRIAEETGISYNGE